MSETLNEIKEVLKDNEKVKDRKKKDQQAIIDMLKTTPRVQTACMNCGISRATYYRWCDESQKFEDLANEAIAEGEDIVNDICESKIITFINEGKLPAIKLWLRSHRQNYRL
jgi:ACT domain-containing protein